MIRILLALTWLIVAHPVFAIDTALRISDREIIESLAEIKIGQKALENKMEQRFSAVQEQMDLRFASMQEQMNARFTAADQRFATIDQRFTAMQTQFDHRFESVNQRLDFMENLMLVLIAGVFGLIGFIVWDRYSTLRPMDMRLRRIEEDLENDLELKSPEGSRLIRMIHALRELAKEDKKVEAVLRNFSLL